MTHPYRVRVSVIALNSYGPAPSPQERKGPSPLVDVRLVESGLSASTPAAPKSRNQALSTALGGRVIGHGINLYSRDFLTASPSSFGSLPGGATFTVMGSERTVTSTEMAHGREHTETFGLATLTSGYSVEPVTAAGLVHALSDLPIGAEAWFQFVNDPVTGSPFASPRWYFGTLEGTPAEVRVDPRGAPAPVTYAATTLYAELSPAVLTWFGESLAELTPIGTPSDGAPAVFRGPDGIPVNSVGAVAELGTMFLAAAPGKVIALAPVGRPVTDPWTVIKL